jgi:hypothetical protein
VGSKVVSDEGLIKGGACSRFEELAALPFLCACSAKIVCAEARAQPHTL